MLGSLHPVAKISFVFDSFDVILFTSLLQAGIDGKNSGRGLRIVHCGEILIGIHAFALRVVACAQGFRSIHFPR